jgi:DMSO/TMAO reductase YedYZ molybdopterin-dependent catalytic subunit
VRGCYGYFCGTIPLQLAANPQAILALAVSGAPLPVGHGAPLRLRVETQLGFTMAKWIKGIEFAAGTSDIVMGVGMGGWRVDQQFYANDAGI